MSRSCQSMLSQPERPEHGCAGGAGKPQQDVESGLSESFTSAVSKLDGDAASPSPSHAEAMPEEVQCIPCLPSVILSRFCLVGGFMTENRADRHTFPRYCW